MGRRFGWKGVGVLDQRDLHYSYARMFPRVDAPRVKSLICGPVVDQSKLGSCGAFSAIYNIVAKEWQNNEEPQNLSQLFAYYVCREMFGHVEYDDGVFLRDMIKALATKGVCLEDTWPYVINNFAKRPPTACYTEAANNKIKSYHALLTTDDMIQCMASDYGFIGGITVYESFDSEYTARTGIVQMPSLREKVLGGHAIYFGGGYDLNRGSEGMIKFENSYGRGWGDGGFGWIPLEYLAAPHLAGDFWTIRL